jgi:hypothetical protein
VRRIYELTWKSKDPALTEKLSTHQPGIAAIFRENPDSPRPEVENFGVFSLLEPRSIVDGEFDKTDFADGVRRIYELTWKSKDPALTGFGSVKSCGYDGEHTHSEGKTTLAGRTLRASAGSASSMASSTKPTLPTGCGESTS